jgi:hypothetical protein
LDRRRASRLKHGVSLAVSRPWRSAARRPWSRMPQPAGGRRIDLRPADRRPESLAGRAAARRLQRLVERRHPLRRSGRGIARAALEKSVDGRPDAHQHLRLAPGEDRAQSARRIDKSVCGEASRTEAAPDLTT